MSNTSLLGSFGGQGDSSLMFRNRIINGDMRIDQRNAGAAVTITVITGITYVVDRFYGYGGVASKFSLQRNAGAVTPPAGFTNYLGATSLSAYTTGAAEEFNFGQPIEGFNIADLAWGTSAAQSITISFWARSSLTGTFSGAIRNNATNRSYVFAYTISAANTWELKTVTIPGDTSGTWLTDNSVGLYLSFSLGAGSSKSTTAGSWQAGSFVHATGATSVVGTNGATLYITGVQLEAGPTATPFERRPIGVELSLCQRYFTSGIFSFSILTAVLTNADGACPFKVSMRATPAVVLSSVSQSSIAGYTATASQISTEGFARAINSSGNFANSITPVAGVYTANAEL